MKEKINNIEFSSTLFLILFSCTLGIAPYITIKIAGIDSYIGVIIGSIISLIPLFIFIYIFNYEIDKPIYQKTKIIFGNTLGTIINIFLTILYFILAITILFNTSNFIISQYLTDTPITLVIIILSPLDFSFISISLKPSSLSLETSIFSIICNPSSFVLK